MTLILPLMLGDSVQRLHHKCRVCIIKRAKSKVKVMIFVIVTWWVDV